MEEKRRINWKAHIIAAIISIIIGAGVFLIFFLTNKSLIGAMNGVTLAGVILISIGGLSFVARQGFFDFASYGFKQLGSMIFGRVPNAYHDYPSYKEFKEENRKGGSHFYITILIIGLLFIASYFILKLFFE